ncbi:MAG: hypothetical protein ACPHIW_01100 [Ilumatobacteraceae bacterium]
MRMNHRVRPFVVTAVAFVLSGCLAVDYAITVHEDGSGEVEASLGLDIGVLGAFAGGEIDRDEACEEFSAEFDQGAGVIAEAFDEGDICGVRISAGWTASDDAERALAGVLDDDSISLGRTGDGGWRMEFPFGDDVLGDATGGDDGMEEFARIFLSDASFVVSVTLPGSPVEHNADEVLGSTFTWDIDLFDPPDTLYAETGPVDSTSAVSVVVIVVSVLAVAGLIAAFVITSRRGRSTA